MIFLISKLKQTMSDLLPRHIRAMIQIGGKFLDWSQILNR